MLSHKILKIAQDTISEDKSKALRNTRETRNILDAQRPDYSIKDLKKLIDDLRTIDRDTEDRIQFACEFLVQYTNNNPNAKAALNNPAELDLLRRQWDLFRIYIKMFPINRISDPKMKKAISNAILKDPQNQALEIWGHFNKENIKKHFDWDKRKEFLKQGAAIINLLDPEIMSGEQGQYIIKLMKYALDGGDWVIFEHPGAADSFSALASELQEKGIAMKREGRYAHE